MAEEDVAIWTMALARACLVVGRSRMSREVKQISEDVDCVA
jgi:hypothetical protein